MISYALHSVFILYKFQLSYLNSTHFQCAYRNAVIGCQTCFLFNKNYAKFYRLDVRNTRMFCHMHRAKTIFIKHENSNELYVCVHTYIRILFSHLTPSFFLILVVGVISRLSFCRGHCNEWGLSNGSLAAVICLRFARIFE